MLALAEQQVADAIAGVCQAAQMDKPPATSMVAPVM
jgi:hypothetical protein